MHISCREREKEREGERVRKVIKDEVDEEGDIEALVVSGDDYAVLVLVILVLPLFFHCYGT